MKCGSGRSVRPHFKPRSEPLTVFTREVSLDCPSCCLWHHHHHHHESTAVVSESSLDVVQFCWSVQHQQFVIKGGVRPFDPQLSSSCPAEVQSSSDSLTLQYLVITHRKLKLKESESVGPVRSWSHGTRFWTSLKRSWSLTWMSVRITVWLEHLRTFKTLFLWIVSSGFGPSRAEKLVEQNIQTSWFSVFNHVCWRARELQTNKQVSVV